MSSASDFSNKRQFIAWMKEQARKTGTSTLRVAIGYEPTPWAVKAEVLHSETLPNWADRVVELPMPQAALGQLWDAIQEENLCLFFRHDGWTSSAIVVAARAGVWKSLDERWLATKKNSFREISYDDACLLIGDKQACSNLAAEVQLFGIGCRVLHHVERRRGNKQAVNRREMRDRRA